MTRLLEKLAVAAIEALVARLATPRPPRPAPSVALSHRDVDHIESQIDSATTRYRVD